jgi:hypothetical protein
VWPDRATVGNLDVLLDDRHLYPAGISVLSSATVGTSVAADITFSSIFAGGMAGLSVTYSIGNLSAGLADMGTGEYKGSVSIPNSNSYAGATSYTITATAPGWVTVAVSGSFTIISSNLSNDGGDNGTTSNTTRGNGTSDPAIDPAGNAFTYTCLGTGTAGGLVLTGTGVHLRRRQPKLVKDFTE